MRWPGNKLGPQFSKEMVDRISHYDSYLQQLAGHEQEYVTISMLARTSGATEDQVRADMAELCGRREEYGFLLAEALSAVQDFLGRINIEREAMLDGQQK